MEITNFTIDELTQLEGLLQTSTNVSNILDNLCKLEIKGKKDTEEYHKYLLELTRAINIENEKYQNENLSHQQCHKYARLLSNQTNIPIFNNKPTNNLKLHRNIVVKRVINILINIMQNDKNFHKNMITEPFIEQIVNMGIGITENDFLKGIEHSIKIQSTLDIDVNSMFLSILEDYISKKEYQQYQEELIKAKYYIMISNKELEAIIILQKLNIPNTIYMSSKLINEIFQAGELSFDIIRFSELKTKAQTEINQLLQIKDSEYNNPTTYVNSIISSCYLRALFSLMKDNEINDFKQEFLNQIDKPAYLREHLYDRISENIIINCFKCFKYDTGRIRILSTKS